MFDLWSVFPLPVPFVHHTIPPQMCRSMWNVLFKPNTVRNYCLHPFFVSGNWCTIVCFFSVCRLNRYCLCKKKKIFSHVIYICMLWVPTKSLEGRVCTTTDLTALKNKPQNNQILLSIISVQCLWKIASLKVRMFTQIMPIHFRALTGNCTDDLRFLWERNFKT